MPISPISSTSAALALAQPQAIAAKSSPATASFSQALDSLSQTQNNSDALMQKLSAGENVDLADVMISAQETDVSFRVAMALRDKLVDSYHEVMRMSV